MSFESSPHKCEGQEDLLTHKDIYKKTPKGWKEKFRKGCIQRLRQNRDKLVQRLRSVDENDDVSQSERSQEFIDQLMKEELNEVEELENSQLYSFCCNENLKNGSQEAIDDILKVMDEIRQELIKEEKLILQEFDELQDFDEKYLCAAIECLGTDYVICPICKRNQLSQNHQMLSCVCGLQIDTGYDGITLANVKKRIEDTTQQHRNCCPNEAIFSVLRMEELELHNLILSCKICNFMEIVV